MYRALYGFRSAEPNSLAFAVGETFLLLERSNQHWWLVTRAGSGETGYVPASYLQRLQVRQGGKGRARAAVGSVATGVAEDRLGGFCCFPGGGNARASQSAGFSARRSEAKARCRCCAVLGPA